MGLELSSGSPCLSCIMHWVCAGSIKCSSSSLEPSLIVTRWTEEEEVVLLTLSLLDRGEDKEPFTLFQAVQTLQEDLSMSGQSGQGHSHCNMAK